VSIEVRESWLPPRRRKYAKAGCLCAGAHPVGAWRGSSQPPCRHRGCGRIVRSFLESVAAVTLVVVALVGRLAGTVVPVIYTYLDGWSRRRIASRRAAAIPPAPVVRGADD
jgi:hypothetical protein